MESYYDSPLIAGHAALADKKHREEREDHREERPEREEREDPQCWWHRSGIP